jgi:hypothetical protein
VVNVLGGLSRATCILLQGGDPDPMKLSSLVRIANLDLLHGYGAWEDACG